MAGPEIAILLSTYQRPWHLRRSLLSIAAQQGVSGMFEVVVTDDGSRDETPEVVEALSRQVPFRVAYTTHPHDGFRLAQCRNEGVAQSTAPYLLFTDGDCLLPPDHLAIHLAARRRGRVVAGDCYRLDEAATVQVDESDIRSGQYMARVAGCERRRIAARAWRGWLYSLLRCRMRPRLTGSNIALWRDDFECINGFDENYVGWGLEDRDLQWRLSRRGLRFQSILRKTAAYHLWHPSHETFVRNNKGTPNLRYYERKDVAIRCENGLLKPARWPAVSDGDEEPVGEYILPFPQHRDGSRQAIA